MRRRALPISLIAVAVFVLDQATKYLASTRLPLNRPVYPLSWMEPYISLTYIQNTGAAFGLLQNQNLFFSIVAIVVISITIAYLRVAPHPNPVVALALGLQLGGAFGNLADRLRHGYVVDFVDLKFWPIFNVADSCISVGTVILGIYLVFLSPAGVARGETVERQESAGPPCG